MTRDFSDSSWIIASLVYGKSQKELENIVKKSRNPSGADYDKERIIYFYAAMIDKYGSKRTIKRLIKNKKPCGCKVGCCDDCYPGA